MNVHYFKEHIPDELHGAKDYIKQAIEIKAMSPAWAKSFAEMSANELEHANNLYKMFQEYYAKISGSFSEMPKYIEEAKEEIDEEYVECSATIKYLHDMFKL